MENVSYKYVFENKEFKNMNEAVQQTFNIPFDGNVGYIILGQYRKNKKGTDIFDTTKDEDYLIYVSWGGAFNKSRGIEIDKIKGYKYYRRATSNGGGSGCDYIVISKDFKNKLTIDDI